MISLRTTSLTISLSSLLTNALTTLLARQLPADDYLMSDALSWYAWFAVGVSWVGVWGAWQRDATKLSFFSAYYTIETILSFLLRTFFILCIFTFQQDLCTFFTRTPNTFSPIHEHIPHGAPPSHHHHAAALGGRPGTGVYEGQFGGVVFFDGPHLTEQTCRNLVETLPIESLVSVVLAIGAAVQVLGAVVVHRYANELCMRTEWRDQRRRRSSSASKGAWRVEEMEEGLPAYEPAAPAYKRGKKSGQGVEAPLPAYMDVVTASEVEEQEQQEESVQESVRVRGPVCAGVHCVWFEEDDLHF